jgi:hypothetical protein
VNRATFVHKYRNWETLPFTRLEQQQWYRLRLPFRTGWLGRGESLMDVDFFDASGEGLLTRDGMGVRDRELWKRAYLDARVMVFCLPLWAAFPNSSLSDADWKWQSRVLTEFGQVVQNYRKMRSDNHDTRPVTTILALTMADDVRTALQTLRSQWITPFIDSPETYLPQLRTGRGVARYLANARRVSDALHKEFAASTDVRVAAIPDLDFGRGRPWIVALSAMEGARLEHFERDYESPDDRHRQQEVRAHFPTPVHVELPLLVALAERYNALM